MKNNVFKEIWLFISAFGIMFAFFSWLQESLIIPGVQDLGYLKGYFSLISGIFLYIIFRKKL